MLFTEAVLGGGSLEFGLSFDALAAELWRVFLWVVGGLRDFRIGGAFGGSGILGAAGAFFACGAFGASGVTVSGSETFRLFLLVLLKG